MTITLTAQDLIDKSINADTTRQIGLAVVEASNKVVDAEQAVTAATAALAQKQAALLAAQTALAKALEASHNATTQEFG